MARLIAFLLLAICGRAFGGTAAATVTLPTSGVYVGGDWSNWQATGTGQVWYGVTGVAFFVVDVVQGQSVGCNPGVFGGDPTPGYAKGCYFVPQSLQTPAATDLTHADFQNEATLLQMVIAGLLVLICMHGYQVGQQR